MSDAELFDIAIAGGGINGAGIAADAAGRGLKVILAEKGDLAGATSSASSKLIHGGLRYLEHYEFRLVREALQEREVLLAKAGHIIWPLRFVLPHVTGLRPRWMIRTGLFLYDHLYWRQAIPASAPIDLAHDPAGRPLKPQLTSGFTYWDCWVDDARLVVLNARAAAQRGAEILTRTEVVSLVPDGDVWGIELKSGLQRRRVRARTLVNAAGPWVGGVDAMARGNRSGTAPARVRLVKGSHIVVPRIQDARDAYLMQSADKRVVFVLPYEERFTIIGTTDVVYDGDPAKVAIAGDEEAYLTALASEFFRAPIQPSDIVWRYSGVRPLYDDASDNPSAITRDYKLVMSDSETPPMLSIYGGKVTTYRRLAEETLHRLARHLPDMGPDWTAKATLPGGDLPGRDFDAALRGLIARFPNYDAAQLRRLARRHGSLTADVIGDAQSLSGMGQHFGHGLTEREVVYMRQHEWAREPDDVLWRRSKVGLHLAPADRDAAAEAIGRLL
jgi:glycerol-3-phosphate dehydrogenase